MLFDQLLVEAVSFKNQKNWLVDLCRDFCYYPWLYGFVLDTFSENSILNRPGVCNKFLLPIPFIESLMMDKVVDSSQMLRVKLMAVFAGNKLICKYVSLVPKDLHMS